MTFLIPVVYHLISNRSLLLILSNIVKLLLPIVLPRSSLSSGRPPALQWIIHFRPHPHHRRPLQNRCHHRPLWHMQRQEMERKILTEWCTDGFSVLDIALNNDDKYFVSFHSRRRFPPSHFHHRSILPMSSTMITTTPQSGINLESLFDSNGNNNHGFATITGSNSSSLSAMSQTKSPAIHHAVKTFLSISRLCMCRRSRLRRRFCSRRRRWRWGGSAISVARRGPPGRESSREGRPITII